MAETNSTNDRNISVLTALLRRPGIVWRLVDARGCGEELGPTPAAERLLSTLRGHPELVLTGAEPRGCTEVRWREGGLQAERSTMPEARGGCDLRVDRWDPRVDRTILTQLLAAGAIPGELGEGQRREHGAAAFLSRLIDLLDGCESPSILECAAGPAPLGLALLACLKYLGRGAELILLDEAEQAIENARLLACRLGLHAEFHAMPISAFEPAAAPDLLLAVHACGRATLEALALGLELGVSRLILVPCCAPEGSGSTAGLVCGEAGDDPLLRSRLDAVGLILQTERQLRLAGYENHTFEAYLRPWRTVELGLAAYLPPP